MRTISPQCITNSINHLATNMMLSYTHQPFLVPLVPFLVKPLHGDNDPSPGLRCRESVLIKPSFKDRTETSLSQHAVGTEIPCGALELAESKALQVGRLQDLALGARGRRSRRGGYPAARATQSLSILATAPRICTYVQYRFKTFKKTINLSQSTCTSKDTT